MPSSANPWQIRSDQRAAFIGKTDSGKSYAARGLLTPAPRLIVFDPKGELLLPSAADWKLDAFTEKAFKRLVSGGTGRLCIGPPDIDEVNEGRYWNSYLKQIMYHLTDCLVYIDELYGVGPPRGTPGLRALYTRGRSRRLGAWAATQRPADIPTYCLSEAEWIFMFKLNAEQDVDRMRRRLGNIALHPMEDHNVIIAPPKGDPVFYNKLTFRRRSA